MGTPLRSLSGLLDFECAARWGSFKLAGKELHKTPAAVSQQIKQLERQLGFGLFHREPRRVVLTDKGAVLAGSVRNALDELNEMVNSLRAGEEENVLRLSVPHSLSMKWLVPRLDDFHRQHPEIDLRIEASDERVEPGPTRCDLALRIGGSDAGEHAVPLGREELVAVYSPELSEGATLDRRALRRLPLLYQQTPETWLQWLRANRALRGEFDFQRGFSHSGMLVQAAIAAQGIALVPYAIACEDLRAGRLLQLPGKPLATGCRYHVIHAPGALERAPVSALLNWLRAGFESMACG